MPATPSLPTVIGRTENALRALLAKTLSPTPIHSYPQWVVLNALASDVSAATGRWRPAATDTLKVGDDVLDEALAQLRDANLIDSDGKLTVLGGAQLAAARAAVAATTASLVESLGDDERETARTVLDHVRSRAEELLHA